MSAGRFTMRGRVYQGRVFSPFVLAGAGAVVAHETRRHTLYGTTLERHTLYSTTLERQTLRGATP